MSMRLRIHAFGLTSLLSNKNHRTYSKYKLSRSNDREPSHNAIVFRSHGPYPATIPSGISSGVLSNERSSKPQGQHYLCKEGANCEGKDKIPRDPITPIFMGT